MPRTANCRVDPSGRPVNHLAHALLAGADPERMLGSLLGDFVRGAIDPVLPALRREGIAQHRAIDRYTDTHPQVVAARGLFAPPFRRYAGIVIDVWFDHLLARDFAQWSDEPLADFSGRVQRLLQAREAILPDGLRRFSRYLHAHDLPLRYRERAMIGQVLAGVGSRLSRANPLAAALEAVAPIEPQLDAAFAAFFPDLVEFARRPDRWRA